MDTTILRPFYAKITAHISRPPEGGYIRAIENKKVYAEIVEARSILIDFLNESLKPHWAECQRWLGQTGRFPVDYWGHEEGLRDCFGWGEFVVNGPMWHLIKARAWTWCQVPLPLFQTLLKNPEHVAHGTRQIGGTFAFFQSFLHAEVALMQAWETLITPVVKRGWFGTRIIQPTFTPDYTPVTQAAKDLFDG